MFINVHSSYMEGKKKASEAYKPLSTVQCPVFAQGGVALDGLLRSSRRINWSGHTGDLNSIAVFPKV